MILPNNRGMFLEELINYTINDYRKRNLAIIYKRPVEIIPVVKNGNHISKAYFKEKSTCDYYGLYQGTYLEFETKETNQTKFNLNSLKQHQFKQLELVNLHKGISFIIVYFRYYDRYFLLPYHALNNWIVMNTTKQIPLQYFEDKGYELSISYPSLLDFIHILNRLISYI
ncbi:Holliday junction resolvase RecU [Spiroplasma sp. DGKH1]|uniref:Holliday junction resolvase RecU n=1 Tax=Spiroplasma sp. DGKH1 TaxID=3050074 RepID=UPI0034C6544A